MQIIFDSHVNNLVYTLLYNQKLRKLLLFTMYQIQISYVQQIVSVA